MSSVRAERQLILLSAGISARRTEARVRARELAGQVEWGGLADRLRARRLLGVLGPRLQELSGDLASPQFASALERELEYGRRRGIYLQLVCQRVLAMLAASGIRSAALKGPQLSEFLYGDPGRRISGDLDLLVPADQLQEAVQVVRTLGYAKPVDHLEAGGLPLLHLVLAHERGELPTIELHWRVHWYEQSFAAERLLPALDASPVDWRPEPVDELAALLLFYARDGFVELRLASDLSAWWDTRGASLGDGALEQTTLVYPALRRVLRGAAKAAESIVGLPMGRLFGDELELGARERAAARLADPHPDASLSQLYADMGLIDGLLAPPGGFGAFVRRQLLPPRAVLDEQARHGARRRSRSRSARCAGVLGRYALSARRLLRASETIP